MKSGEFLRLFEQAPESRCLVSNPRALRSASTAPRVPFRCGARQDGSKADIFGATPKGLYVFTSNGHSAIVNVRPDLPKFASNNRNEGTPEEIKRSFRAALPCLEPTQLATKSSLSKSKAALGQAGRGQIRSETFLLQATN